MRVKGGRNVIYFLSYNHRTDLVDSTILYIIEANNNLPWFNEFQINFENKVYILIF